MSVMGFQFEFGHGPQLEKIQYMVIKYVIICQAETAATLFYIGIIILLSDDLQQYTLNLASFIIKW